MQRTRAWFVVGSAVAGLLCATGVRAGGGAQWNSAGGDLRNSRFQPTETRISVANVGSLTPKWVFTTGGDVSATPAVDGSRVYVPSWDGYLYAVDASTGKQVWRSLITDATGVAGDKSRTTPVISGSTLVVGTQGNFGGGGKVLAYNKNTGQLLWSTQADSHLAAIITQSATIRNGIVYVGVSSIEEALAASGSYPCCSFRGSMLALSLETGAILWKTYMVPEGYTGGAIWGSSPAIDVKRGQVYIATGNNYSVPEAVLTCVANAGGDPDVVRGCVAADNHIDAVLALDLLTGQIRWVTEALPYDAWTVGCIPIFGDGENCPEPAGPDYDFGQAPALYTARGANGKMVDYVGAGQKSGQYWAFDPATGAVRWVTETGPGGTAGGLQWGSAVDDARVYTANANSNLKPWTLPDGTETTQGIWSGLNAATGQILWQTTPPHGGGASGPVTTANGVVFGCALDPDGFMYALNAATGAVLWEFESGGSCLSGAAIANGTIYWGSGYSNFGFGTPNNKLYAFTTG